MRNSLYIYIIVFILTILIMRIFAFFSEKANTRTIIFFAILFSIPLALLSGLRLGVGTDYYNYEYVYKSATDFFQVGMYNEVFITTEPLFVVVEWLAYTLSGENYHVFLFLISLFTLTPVNFFIMQNVPKKQMAFSISIYLVIYFLASFNILRQMLAVSIVIYSFKYLINRKKNAYFITIIIATLVHNSAIIAIALFFLDVDISLKSKITVKQLIAIIGLLMVPIVYIIVLTLGPSLPLIGQYFQNYSNIQNESNIYFILLTLSPIIPVFFFKKVLKEQQSGMVMYNVLLFTLIVAVLGFINEWAFRLMYYPASIIVCVYPIIIDGLKLKSKIIFKVVILVYLIIVSYLTYDTFGFSNVLPYESVPVDTLFMRN